MERVSPALAGGFLTTVTGEALLFHLPHSIFFKALSRGSNKCLVNDYWLDLLLVTLCKSLSLSEPVSSSVQGQRPVSLRCRMGSGRRRLVLECRCLGLLLSLSLRMDTRALGEV